MKLDRYSQSILNKAVLKRGVPAEVAAPAIAEAQADMPYAPSPFEARVDTLNQRILESSLSQAQADFNIHALMFEPVANVQRRRTV